MRHLPARFPIRSNLDLAIASVTLIGLLYKLRIYLFNRSLWLDEAFFANNLIQHDIGYLLTNQLDYNQSSPIGFLILQKGFGWLLQYADFSLRIAPLIFGILLSLLGLLVLHHFSHPASKLLFVAMLAFAPIVLYYSTESKQYILDMCMTLLLWWGFLSFQQERIGAAALWTNGALALFFSQPSIFVLAAIGIVLLAARIRQKKNAWLLITVGVAWVGQFYLQMFVLSGQPVGQETVLMAYWSKAFPPFSSVGAYLQWIAATLAGLSFNGFWGWGILPAEILAHIFDWQYLLLYGLVILGLIVQFRKHTSQAWVIILSTGFLLVTAHLHLYPAHSRPVLFLLPFVYILIAQGINFLIESSNKVVQQIGYAGALVSIFGLAIPSTQVVLFPNDPYDMKSALTYVEQHAYPGDQYSISAWSLPAFNLYENRYDLSQLTRAANFEGGHTLANLQAYLCNSAPNSPVWMVFTHRYNEVKPMIEASQDYLVINDTWNTTGAGVYRISLGTREFCDIDVVSP